MSDRLAELHKVHRLLGDTYSSEEVIDLMGWAIDEIERLKEICRDISDVCNTDPNTYLAGGDLRETINVIYDLALKGYAP